MTLNILVKVDFDVVKQKFYSACNCVLSNSYNTNELIELQLQESYCLPILTYACAGLNPDASHIKRSECVLEQCVPKKISL